MAAEIEAMRSPGKRPDDKQQPRREKLPPHLPRRDFHHEPQDTTCGCGTPMQRIGEDVAEKLDYEPGVLTVERHIRGRSRAMHSRTLTLAVGLRGALIAVSIAL